MTLKYVDMGVLQDQNGNTYLTHIGLGDAPGTQELTEFRDENGSFYYADNNGARQTPYNGDYVKTGDGGYIYSGGQDRPAPKPSAYSETTGQPPPPDAQLSYVGTKPVLVEAPENKFNPVGFIAEALSQPGMGLLLAGLGGNLAGWAGGAASGAGGAETLAGGTAADTLGGAADLIGSDWATGVAGSMNPGLLSGTAGYSLPGATSLLPGNGGMTPSLTDLGAYQNPITSNLISGTSSIPEAVAGGMPALADVFAPFIGGNVGGVAPELGGTGAITGDLFTDLLRNIFSPSASGGGSVADLITGSGGNIWDLLGPALGAIVGGVGTSEGGTDVTVNAPWGPQQPYYEDLWANAQRIFGETQNPTADELAFYNNYMGQLGQAQDLASRTMAGEFLDPTNNPAYQNMMSNALNQWNNAYIPGLMSSSYGMDMTGSLPSNSAFGQNVYQGERAFGQNLGQSFAANIWNPERSNMQQAMTISPMLGEAGMNATNVMAQYPWQALNNYARAVQPSAGQVTMSPYAGGNAAAGALGGALTGAAIQNLLFPR